MPQDGRANAFALTTQAKKSMVRFVHGQKWKSMRSCWPMDIPLDPWIYGHGSHEVVIHGSFVSMDHVCVSMGFHIHGSGVSMDR